MLKCKSVHVDNEKSGTPLYISNSVKHYVVMHSPDEVTTY